MRRARRWPVGLLLVAACGSPDQVAGPTPISEPPASDVPLPEPMEPTAPPATAGELRTLPETFPTMRVVVDGTVMPDAPLQYDSWGDEWVDPPERDPRSGVLAVVGDEVTMSHPLAERVDGETYRLIETSRFALDGDLDGGTGVNFTPTEPGLYAMSVLVRFGPSDEYAGSGTMRAAIWVQAVPADAPCSIEAPGPFTPSGLVDESGCPIPDDAATLWLAELLPWFHCAPWPPTFVWDDHPFTEATRFERVDADTRLVDVVALPADATPTGWFLPAGQILTAASDPDAVFVALPDGTAERWDPPDPEYGCA